MPTTALSAPSVLPALRGPLAAWALVSVAHVVAFLAATALVPLSAALQPPEEAAAASGLAMLAVSAVDSALLTAVVRRSDLRGWRLVGVLTFAWWGLATFMTQIETAWFLDAFPRLGVPDLLRLFVSGLLFAGLWVPVAVRAAGGFAPVGAASEGAPAAPSATAAAPLGGAALVGRLAALSVLYAALYFTFGYFVAWQWSEVRVFYAGDMTLPTFAGQLAQNAAADPWLYPFQLLRGVLWAFCAAPVALLFRRRAEAALLVGLLCALAPTTQLLYPNVLMPEAVRVAHFLEVSTSTGLFGMAAALLLGRR